MVKRLTANSFKEADELIPRNDGVQFIGVWKTPIESINQKINVEITTGEHFYIDYPEQLAYSCTLKYGAWYVYGYGDNPCNALLNAIHNWYKEYGRDVG